MVAIHQYVQKKSMRTTMESGAEVVSRPLSKIKSNMAVESPIDRRDWKFDDLARDFKHVLDYVHTIKEIMNAHMVDFFTLNHWDTLLSPRMRGELESLLNEELTSLPSLVNDVDCGAEYLGLELREFVLKAKKAQLKSFPWVKDRKHFSSDGRLNFISHIMTPKKSYEVEVMSDVIYSLTETFQVNKIVDLGSGKGYLSQYLAMQYGLKVIGIDSSDSNTQNAAKRNERLLCAWGGLLTRSSRETGNAYQNTPGGTWSHYLQPHVKMTDQVVNSESCSVILSEQQSCHQSGAVFDPCGLIAKCSVSCNEHACSLAQRNSITGEKIKSVSWTSELWPACDPSYKSENVLSNHSDSGYKTWLINKQSGAFQNSTNSSQSNFHGTIHDSNFSDIFIDRRTNNTHCQTSTTIQVTGTNTTTSKTDRPQSSNFNSFLPITGFVNQSFLSDGELGRLFNELSPCGGGPNEDNGLFLVGLHTCGNLASTALRIFSMEPRVKLLCIVGCCYHTITQEFGFGDSTEESGFPLSEFCRQFKPHLSRNATMVAQQAADRIAAQAKLPPPSVLYRAILQVILQEKFHLDGRGMHVGKIGAKCKDFKEYVRKALKKLQLKEDALSDEEMESYLERFRTQERHLHAFHQLRATIAPCIESVFLLDRLCYLYEQNITSAWIVRMFDPVKSPRCYAIIASKP